ncbi:MAG: CynX/NimT family MFS transporter [Actinomycetota bacterium]
MTTLGTSPVFFVGALVVQIRDELDFDVSQIGILTAVFFFSSALISSVAGRVSEGTGAPVAMKAGMTVSVVALSVIALANSWWQLVAGLALGGVASAVAQVSSNLFVTSRTDQSRQGFAFGIKQAAIPAATLVGGVSVPVIALTVGWRWAFAGAAVLSALLVPGIPRDAPRGAGPRWRGGRRPDAPLGPLAVLAFGGALGSAAANSLGAFLVDSSVTIGTAEGTAGLLAALGSACGLITRVAGGWAADRAAGGRLLWVSALLALGGAGYVLLATGNTGLLVPATLVGFVGGWGWPGLFNFAVVIRNRSAPAAATGITQTGVYLGGVIGPIVFGLVAQHASYGAAWSLSAALAAAGAVTILVGRRLLLRAT